MGDGRNHGAVMFQNNSYYASHNRENLAMIDFYRIKLHTFSFLRAVLQKNIKYRGGFKAVNEDGVLILAIKHGRKVREMHYIDEH